MVNLTRPNKLLKKVQRRLREQDGNNQEDSEQDDWLQKLQSKKGWRQVARQYFMEWGMVWKDVTVGFTVAGIIAAFVPKSFFQALFIG